MIDYNYTHSPDQPTRANDARQTGSPGQFQDTSQTIPPGIVAGTTAGTASPGSLGFPGLSPAPTFFGSTLPPQIAAQQAGQIQTTEDMNPYTVAPGSPIVLGPQYFQGYLRTLVGRRMKVTFFLGEDISMDLVGQLLFVGAEHFIIREVETDDLTSCDFETLTFVEVFE